MGLNITDEAYGGQPSLYANAGQWISGSLDIGNFFSAGSGDSNKFTLVDDTITIQSGQWGDYGFTEGMTISIEFDDYSSPPPSNPQTFSRTITYINGDVMHISSALAGYAQAIFPTSGSLAGMLIYADASPDALEFYFNLTPNGSNSVVSVLDNQVNRFEVQDLGSLAISSSVAMTQVNNKSGGWIKDVQITRNANSAPLQYGGTSSSIQRNYTITYKFIQWGLLQDGFNPPDYYNAANDLAPYIKVNTYGIYGNPNSIQSTENGAALANTGYFDENYNGGSPSYTKDSISFTDLNGDAIDKIDYSNYTDFVAVVDAPNQVNGSSVYRIGLAFLPVDTTQYQNLLTNAGENLLINAPDTDFNHSTTPSATVYTGEANSDGARFDLTNLKFENLGSNKIEVSGRITPLNTSDETIDYFSQFPDGERRMVIWAQFGDYTKVNQYSDQVNVLLYDGDNFDAPTIGVQIPTVVSELVKDHGENDITSNTFKNTTTEDNVLYVSEFTLPSGVEYDGVRAGIYAYNTVTEEAFTLEEFYMDFTNQPYVSGVHEVDIEIPRNFFLTSNSNRNAITLARKASLDGGGQYGLELNYGFLNKWQYWLSLAAANNDFFDATQVNNGLNQDWQHYDLSGSGDWILRLSYFTRLNDVDDFNHYQLRIRDYEDDANVSIVETITRLSDSTTPSAYVADEMHSLRVDFVWNQSYSSPWAELTLENKEGSRIGFISSVNDDAGLPDNVYAPLAGETGLKITNLGTTLRAECLVDASKINVDEVSPTYRVFSLPKDSAGPIITNPKDAELAYSLRKVSSNNVYSDSAPCIRVRRSSDNAESDIGFIDNGSGELVLDTTTLLSFTGATGTDYGYITKWYDQAGNGNHAVQTTQANQPLIVNAGAVYTDPDNGLPAVNYDGANDKLDLTLNVVLQDECYAVHVFNRPASTFNSVMLGDDDPTPYSLFWTATANLTSGLGSGAVHSAADTAVGDMLISILRDAAEDVKCYVNGSAKTTVNDANLSEALTTLGATDSTRHRGPMQEVLFWNKDKEVDRALIEANINTFYSIY